MAGVTLKDFQVDCVKHLRSGKVLAAGVGGGKSIMSLWWYVARCCKTKTSHNQAGQLWQILDGSPDLYIITTSKKRDNHEWDKELGFYALNIGDNGSKMGHVHVTVDSWNNIHKYVGIKKAIFIFDEQRAIGSGTWAKSFVKIAKANRWIMLSATPGDAWGDWCPVMVADGFHRNRTEFFRRHAVYSRYSKFPRIERWIDTEYLEQCRAQILITCDVPRTTRRDYHDLIVEWNKPEVRKLMKDRWNPDKNEPFLNSSELCAYVRRVINSDPSRLERAIPIVKEKKRVIIFYTLKVELEEILKLEAKTGIPVYQFNGQQHDPLPTGGKWVYAVQYNAGSEGWNCTTTNTILYWDLPYSYRQYEQAAGRIDRLNTQYTDLHYYKMRSHAPMDLAIVRALNNKKDFNVSGFVKKQRPQYIRVA
jgi:hypothetical protein